MSNTFEKFSILEDDRLKEQKEWEQKYNETVKLRKDEFDRLLNDEKQKYSEIENANHDAVVDMLDKKIKETKETITSIKEKYSSLGFFAFRQKLIFNKLLKDESIKINNLEKKLEDETFEFEQKKSNIDKFFAEIEEDIAKKIMKKYSSIDASKPLDLSPSLTKITANEDGHTSQLMCEITDMLCMSYPEALTAVDLIDRYFPNESLITIARPLRLLCEENIIEMITLGRKTYFKTWI